MVKNGICGHCGETKLLGVRWRGRSTLPQPDWLCESCERDYPEGWTKEQIAEALERLLAFNTGRNERAAAEYARKDIARQAAKAADASHKAVNTRRGA